MPSIEELKLNITSLLKDTFSEFKTNWGKLIGAGFLIVGAALPILAVEVGLLSLTGLLSQGSAQLNWLSYLILPVVFVLHLGFILGILAMQLGFARMCLKMVRKESFVIINELKSGFHLLVPIVLASLVMAPALILGLICFVIPGIYLAMRFTFYSLAIADGYGPIEALKKSFHITRGHLIEMLALFALYQVSNFALAFLPIINLFILLFFMLPFVHFFWAKYYVTLENSQSQEQGSIRFNTASVNA